jgi:hypothetical protein
MRSRTSCILGEVKISMADAPFPRGVTRTGSLNSSVPDQSGRIARPLAQGMRREGQNGSISLTWVMILLGAHIPLALIASRVPMVGTIHALLTLVVGFWWAMSSPVKRVMYILAYIAASEVFWRMCAASLLWEFGKISVIAILLVAMWRRGAIAPPLLPSLYIALLLPGVLFTLFSENLGVARQMISFDFSGPLSLALCIGFCMRLRFGRDDLSRVWFAFLGPTMAVAAIIFQHLTSMVIVFGRNSNMESSGGYGPNQVSASLGMAGLIAFVCATDVRFRRSVRIVATGLIVLFIVLSVITFSRTGLYLFVAGTIVAGAFLIRRPGFRVSVLATLSVLFLLGSFIILPRLETLTSGALGERFASTSLTNRDRIMEADLKIFAEHPVFGIGVGEATIERAKFFMAYATHTEYTRLLAEHGVLGLFAGLVLLYACAKTLSGKQHIMDKVIKSSFLVYGLLFMTVTAMRMVLPSFAVGVAFLSVLHRETMKEDQVRTGILQDEIK